MHACVHEHLDRHNRANIMHIQLLLATIYFLYTDKNECISGLHDCPVNSTCNNTVGSFDCECNDGFFDDGNGRCTGIHYRN